MQLHHCSILRFTPDGRAGIEWFDPRRDRLQAALAGVRHIISGLNTISTSGRPVVTLSVSTIGAVARSLTAYPQPLTARDLVHRPRLPLQLPIVVLANRAALLLVGISAAALLPLKYQNTNVWAGGAPSGIVPAVLSRWDGFWYFSVSSEGYRYHAGQESNVAFTPLLPMLTRIGGALTGRSDADGLMVIAAVISNVALVVALVLLGRLVSRHWDPPVAHRTVLCLLFFPTSFFLSAVYPESLFLACAIGAFLAAEADCWWVAGILGALAALERTYGVLIFLPLVWINIEHYGRKARLNALWLGLIPAALLGWLAYLYLLSGDPLVLLHAEANWRHAATRPDVQTLLRTPTLLVQFGVESFLVLGSGVLVALTWSRLRVTSLAMFATLFYLPIAFAYVGSYGSGPRYVLKLFPVFIVLGQLTESRSSLLLYLGVGSVASLIAMAHFAVGGWVA